MGQLFVFSAPSGAGKSTIVNKLREVVPSIGYSVSHTSREPRGNEADGTHYHFVDKETFDENLGEFDMAYEDFVLADGRINTEAFRERFPEGRGVVSDATPRFFGKQSLESISKLEEGKRKFEVQMIRLSRKLRNNHEGRVIRNEMRK